MLFLWISTGIGVTEVSAQALVVKTRDGAETAQNLNVIQSLSFDSGNLVVKYTGGTSQIYSLSSVSKLYFSNGTTDAGLVSEMASGAGISLYPNPAGSSIRLCNLPQGISVITLYRIDGAVMFQTEVSSYHNVIDISRFTRGLYLLKTGTQTLKFVKL